MLIDLLLCLNEIIRADQFYLLVVQAEYLLYMFSKTRKPRFGCMVFLIEPELRAIARLKQQAAHFFALRCSRL